MKRWLKVTALRTVVALLSISIVIVVLIWLPVQRSRSLVSKQLSLTSDGIKKIKEAENLLASLPAIDEIEIQRQGAAKAYTTNANDIAGSFKAITIIRPKRIKPIFGLGFRQSQIVSDTNQVILQIKQDTLYENASAAIYEADRLMVYHSAVSSSLINVLEYNPAQDTRNFSLDSEDTNKRLALAQEGLRKADENLQAAQKMYDDPSLNEVIASISVLRTARFQLSQNGNTGAWIKIFTRQQKNIISNRTIFWQIAVKDQSGKLADKRRDIQQIHDRWQEVAKKHRVKTS